MLILLLLIQITLNQTLLHRFLHRLQIIPGRRKGHKQVARYFYQDHIYLGQQKIDIDVPVHPPVDRRHQGDFVRKTLHLLPFRFGDILNAIGLPCHQDITIRTSQKAIHETVENNDAVLGIRVYF